MAVKDQDLSEEYVGDDLDAQVAQGQKQVRQQAQTRSMGDITINHYRFW